jgi:hypothetical protein
MVLPRQGLKGQAGERHPETWNNAELAAFDYLEHGRDLDSLPTEVIVMSHSRACKHFLHPC